MVEELGRSPASQGRATGLRPQPATPSSQSSVPNAALLALAERVERAAGRPRNSPRDPDSAKLDCEIWLAINGLRDGRKFRKFIRHRKPGVTEYGAWSARTDRGDVSVYESPSYTYSLDAAMTLAEGLEQFGGVSAMLREAMDRLWQARFYGPFAEPPHTAATYGQALARFFTAACLRARAASGIEAAEGRRDSVAGSTEGESPVGEAETPNPQGNHP